MHFSEYQTASQRTQAQSGDERIDTLVSAVGLVGEAGEVAELLKKHVGHGKHLDSVALAEELGDVLWYVSDIATRAGLGLDTIAARNRNKLRARYPQGFTPEAKVERSPTVRERVERIESLLKQAQGEWAELSDLDVHRQTRCGLQDAMGTVLYWAGDVKSQVMARGE